MRAVSVFPLDEFRLALKKVYGAAAPKGPFTALSQATLFFSRNSCTIACCNLNQWCQATIPAQGDEFSLTLYDTQRLLDACAYFSGELHLEYETAEKKPHNCDIPYKQSSPNAKEESGMKGAGTTAPVNPTEAGKAGEAIQQDQELMKAFLARAGKGEDRLADDFDFLKLKAMYVLLKDVGYTIRLKPMTDPPSPAYQRGDGQEAGSKIEPVPVTESAERSNAA